MFSEFPRALNSSVNTSGEEMADECPSKIKYQTPSGALMLAVCRGKVSEKDWTSLTTTPELLFVSGFHFRT
jgi:hypothetical protein